MEPESKQANESKSGESKDTESENRSDLSNEFEPPASNDESVAKQDGGAIRKDGDQEESLLDKHSSGDISLEEKKVEEEVVKKATSGEPTKPNSGSEIAPPAKKRNSLIDRVKTVTEDGDTDEEFEKEHTREVIDPEDPWTIPDSNLRDPKRRICVVTTAALPWRTGTAVNPLLRALYLTQGRPKHYVTLVIPWCQDEDDRNKTLGKENSFASPAEQEAWIRDFCRTRANCAGRLSIPVMIVWPFKNSC